MEIIADNFEYYNYIHKWIATPKMVFMKLQVFGT
jgi:hypothetical protein